MLHNFHIFAILFFLLGNCHSAFAQTETKATIQKVKRRGGGHCSCPGNGNNRKWDPGSESYVTIDPINEYDFSATAYDSAKWQKAKHRSIVYGTRRTRRLIRKTGKLKPELPKKVEGSYGI